NSRFYLPFSFSTPRRPSSSTLFPYTTLFRSSGVCNVSRPCIRCVITKHNGSVNLLTYGLNNQRLNLPPNIILAVIHDGFRDRNKDRKSTRLNSSHVSISYAVFCLKKKKKYTK